MTTATAADLHPCACGCGELVGGKWKRGHSTRGEGGFTVRRLPSPDEADAMTDDDFDAFDLGPVMPEPGPEPAPGGVSREPPVEDITPDGTDDLSDAPAAHGRRDWARPSRGGKTRRTVKVNAAVRKDIGAKVGLMLEIPGRVWQARDPVCGTAFVDARPGISDALAEIVCQSADLVEWFTGPGGSFMLWLNLAAACWPVVTVILAHHVLRQDLEAMQDATTPPQPDLSRYAA
jgi:hypothetical protein